MASLPEPSPLAEPLAGPRTELVAGLLLAGGHSLRMGRDKAGLDYHGRAQLEHAFSLLMQVAAPCYLAIRPEQQTDPLRQALPCLFDAEGIAGPAAGLVAAQRLQPDVSWLLLACDMPLVSLGVLQALLFAAAADPLADVIAYTAGDGRIEPLCSLWRPSSKDCLQVMSAAPQGGLRRVAEQLRIRLLPSPPGCLDNANTPEESAEILQRLRQGRDPKGG